MNVFVYYFFANLQFPMSKPEAEGATPQIELLFQKH